MAAARKSAVQVFDARNELEARLCYRDGVLAIEGGSYEGQRDVGMPGIDAGHAPAAAR